jgi:uncharacterized protein (DUF1697 family)
MARYAALLRGINLGSRNKIGMPALTTLFEGLGHTDVKTYVQSGNVVFSSSQRSAALERGIHKAIQDELGLDIAVMVRTAAELATLVGGNPYLDRQDDPLKLHVTFLAAEPAPTRVDKLAVPDGETAEFTLAGRDVYLHCPDGYGRTKLSNAFLERKLDVAGTTRNWKTVRALHELTS